MSRPPDIVSFYYFKDGQEPHRIDVGVPPYTARRRIHKNYIHDFHKMIYPSSRN